MPREKSTPLCSYSEEDIPDCQRSAAERLIARTGLSARESRGARSWWVGVFLYCGYTHTHSAPVMLGRFQPAASERSALEFLRPKEISNWVMDMVTWTMRRQSRGRREKEGEREVWNTIWVHYLSPLPMTDLGFSVPKQTYLGIKKGALGSKSGTIELEYVFFFESDSRLERVQGTTFKRWELLVHNVLPLNACSLFICIKVAVISAGVPNSSFIHWFH